MPTRRSRRTPAALALALLAPGALASGALAGAASGVVALVAPARPASAAGLSFTLAWQTAPFADAGNPVALSSPVVATLDSDGPSAVVGDRSGHLYAFHLRDGSPVAGWPYYDGGLPIDSPPSTYGSTVYVGEGNAAVNNGGYLAVNSNGTQRWLTTLPQLPAPLASSNAGVISGLAVGVLQGTTSVVSGSEGQQEDELNASTGAVQPGFPWLATDSNFTTPAIADLYGDGQNEIIEGGDQTGNPATGTAQGGHLRILRQTGDAGTGSPEGGLVCDYHTNQTVQSSPAVGTFLGGGQTGIAFGTGGSFAGASQTDQLLATTTGCQLAWATTLDGLTSSSPALVDALGNGALQVAEGTVRSDGGGSVWLLNGSSGAPVWQARTPGAVIGSVTSADFGEGYQDIVVPTTAGVVVLDGRTGAQVATVETDILAQSSVLVTDDPDGRIGLTVAGYDGGNQGAVAHYTLAGSHGSVVDEAGAWPEFHHDPQLTGDAGAPPPPHCTPPRGGPVGYEMAASDGGVFAFGNTQFCGSTGNIHLNQPVVGTAATVDGGGYWLVASDGGIFDFGDARFYGSTGSTHLNQPIVGMAATPDGRGYWLVASDGGIFDFGDARFYGSTGSTHLNQPIVGMAATPDGRGYWLVASDGGIFDFGDARFYGSTGSTHLNQPVVGMAAVPGTGAGYWLVARDGGIFEFGNAAFYGSTGSVRLNKPIVAMAAVRGGGGYWLFGSDGGVFDFGRAQFYGSTGSVALNRPIVAAAGYGA